MSQQQPRRPHQSDEPIKYGDVFSLRGELAGQPVRPGDAAMMQTAENLVIGQTQKGGAASVMQSAAAHNERAGFVGHGDVTVDPASDGVSVTETDLPDRRVVRESVAGQKVAQFTVPMGSPKEALVGANITVGEALEAAAVMLGDKPMEQSDAAAVQAAEARVSKGMSMTGGVAAAAQSAADINARIMREQSKITIGDVMTDATEKMVGDKAVTREDAEGVVGAEIRNRPDMKTVTGGVAESMVVAARLNQHKMS